jgi:hypothetical protein
MKRSSDLWPGAARDRRSCRQRRSARRSAARRIRNSPPASSSPSSRPSWSIARPCRSEVVVSSISWMTSVRFAASLSTAPGQRVAAERAEAHRALDRHSPGSSGKRSSSTISSSRRAPPSGAARRNRAARSGCSRQDVLPDVELGPVGEREDADALALVLAGIVEVPQLGPLVLRVPAMLAERNEKTRSLARLFSSSRRRRRRPRRSRICRAPASALRSSTCRYGARHDRTD